MGPDTFNAFNEQWGRIPLTEMVSGPVCGPRLCGPVCAGDSEGILAHTQSGKDFYSVKINGAEMSEGSMNALIAGHFGVPVVMVSGDE